MFFQENERIRVTQTSQFHSETALNNWPQLLQTSTQSLLKSICCGFKSFLQKKPVRRGNVGDETAINDRQADERTH
jgi:hypothetical protein